MPPTVASAGTTRAVKIVALHLNVNRGQADSKPCVLKVPPGRAIATITISSKLALPSHSESPKGYASENHSNRIEKRTTEHTSSRAIVCSFGRVPTSTTYLSNKDGNDYKL